MSPNQPKTPGRHVRVDDQTWAAVVARAADEDVTPSEIVRRALAAYVEPATEEAS